MQRMDAPRIKLPGLNSYTRKETGLFNVRLTKKIVRQETPALASLTHPICLVAKQTGFWSEGNL
jgi:hypothetical protein